MKLWEPSADQIKDAQITAFIERIGQTFSVQFDDFQSFYDWTIREPEHFWESLWDFCGISGATGDSRPAGRNRRRTTATRTCPPAGGCSLRTCKR